MAKAKKSKKAKAKKSKKKTRAASAPSRSRKAKKAKKTTKRAKTPARKAKKSPARKASKKPRKQSRPKPQMGEGNYAASRSFLKDQSDFVNRNQDKIPAMGKAAEQAMDGSEGADLRAAEDEARAHSKADGQ